LNLIRVEGCKLNFEINLGGKLDFSLDFTLFYLSTEIDKDRRVEIHAAFVRDSDTFCRAH
jgi:hypothetical protein